MTARVYTHCKVCGKPKQIPDRGPKIPSRISRHTKAGASAYVNRHVYEADPYCSRVCCETDHEKTTA